MFNYKLQVLRRAIEMNVNESMNDFFLRTLTIANKMKIHDEKMEQLIVVEKILRSMITIFDYVVSIE